MRPGRIHTFFSVLLAAAALGSCRGWGSWREVVLAQVGDERLMRSDVTGIASGMSPSDSLEAVRRTVREWVIRQTKLQEAERMWGRGDQEIRRLTEEYREYLMCARLDGFLADRAADTLVTDSMIMSYMSEHKSQFVLDHTVVRGRVIRFPQTYRQADKLLSLMRSDDQESQQDLQDICLKNGFDVRDFTSWTDFDEFLSYLPVRSNRDGEYDYMLTAGGVSELQDGSDRYYYEITSYLAKGQYSPLENSHDAIRRVILSERRNRAVADGVDSLLAAELRNGSIVVNSSDIDFSSINEKTN